MSESDVLKSLLEEIEANEDGSFQVKNQEGFATLTVYKPGKKGRPVSKNEVYKRLKLFGLEKFDGKNIEYIIKEADGKEHRIAEWTQKDSVDSSLELEIFPDKLKASILIHPPKNGGRLLNKEDIVNSLRARGIVHGIQETVIEDTILKQKFEEKIIIAIGTPPFPATSGFIKVHFDATIKPQVSEDERGRADFKNINIIKTIEKDGRLAEKINPKPGIPGTNIFGEEIPFPIAPASEWRIGPNCRLSSDGKELFSTIAGRPVLESNGTIRVDEVVHLEKVDYSTGNVDFPGTIIVDGSVADDFTLRTNGSLIIKQSVGRVFLFAEKDIVLSGGVMGKNGGQIESKSDIYAKFIEQGNIKAAGSIFIEVASMHSELVAGDSIQISGARGELIGGEAIAGKYISVMKLGAVAETKTSIIVGLSPEVLEELKKMKSEIRKGEEILKKVRQSLTSLQKDGVPKKNLKFEEKETLKKLLEIEKKYKDLINNNQSQYEAFVNSYEPETDAYVEIEKFLYPRVTINTGKGKIFQSELRTTSGKIFVYNNQDGMPVIQNNPPRTNKEQITGKK